MIKDTVKALMLMTLIGSQSHASNLYCRSFFEPLTPITLLKILGNLPHRGLAIEQLARFFDGKVDKEIQFALSGKSIVKHSKSEGAKAVVSHEGAESTRLHLQFMGNLQDGNLLAVVRFRDYKNTILDLSDVSPINEQRSNLSSDLNYNTSIVPLDINNRGQYRQLVIESDFFNHPDGLILAGIHFKKAPTGMIESIVVRMVFKYEDGSVSTRTYDFNRVRTHVSN